MAQIEQLRAFLAITDLANLTAAAGRLNKTQSAVSVQIKNLEADLGEVLFERGSRGMSLTHAGARLLPHAKSVIRAYEEMQDLFRDPLRGVLRVGVPDDFEDGRLERVLATFSAEHPGVEVRVSSGCSEAFLNCIDQNTLDIAVKSGVEYCEGTPLYEEALVWVAGRDSKIGSQDIVPLADLEHNCWFSRTPKQALEQAGRPYKIVFSSQSFASVCSAVQAGLAVSMVPERVVNEDMRVLDTKDGLPKLPRLRRTVIRNSKGPQHIINAMNSAIMEMIQS